MTEKIVLTREGYEKLAKELAHLKEVERKKVARMLQEARSHGDLSENAEYHAAKEHQAHVEMRIREIEHLLRLAEIHDSSSVPEGTATLGCRVTVRNLDAGVEASYVLVGQGEADPSNGRISITSPIGSALNGTRAGDIVEVSVPAGTVRLEVLLVERL